MTTVITRGAGSAQALGYAARATAANYIEDVFSTYLYTGNGSTQTITNGIDLSTKGGLVWVKRRDAADSNTLCDTARGATNLIYTNNTNAENSNANTISAFNNNGFSIAAANSLTNANGSPYASWTFRKQAKFFDVVTYTGNGGSNRQISHSLNSTPGAIIIKDITGTSRWPVWHRSNSGNNNLLLNTIDGINSGGMSQTIITASATTFTVTDTQDLNSANTSGNNFVAYLFAHDAGGFGASGSDNVISCGSYTTDGSGNATVSLGYEPQWLMHKSSSTTGNWLMFDVMRGMPVGSTTQYLYPNLSNAEAGGGTSICSPTATGFTISNFAASTTYIYIAIRRGPMKTPTSGTSVYEPVSFTGNNATNTTRGSTVTTDLAIISATNAGSPQATYNQGFYDRLRGEDRSVTSSNTNAEVTGWANTYFNLDQQIGWSNGSNTAYLNSSTITYVTYNLRRAPGFFDVVCYTGTGSATTFSHNLGAVPELMIVKVRTNTSGWQVYTSALANTDYLILNTTAASVNGGSTRWNSTTPTSSVFSLGTHGAVNGSGDTYVAYLFATVAGVSKVGSYTGTGTTLQVNCGFTGGARFVLIKRTDSTGDWYVWDSARGIVAGNDPYLLLNDTAAEVTGTDYVDTYSAGFEISSTAPAAINANGGTFIFLAIA